MHTQTQPHTIRHSTSPRAAVRKLGIARQASTRSVVVSDSLDDGALERRVEVLDLGLHAEQLLLAESDHAVAPLDVLLAT